MKKLLPFEKKLLDSLKTFGLDFDSVSPENPLGIAVSGGADSVSLLVSLSSLFESESLRVISVDHGIRSEEESGGDAAFVKSLCEKFGIKCHVEKIDHGRIEKFALESSLSLEEVARNIRYEAFDSFIKREGLCALCVAHNQNDNLETVLMRFLQGGASESLGGISSTREKIIRPLLSFTRSQIEDYLSEKKIGWRKDSTNCDTKYLRNRIRNVLVPVLNENFPGWENALLLGLKKNRDDEEALGLMAEQNLNIVSFYEEKSFSVPRKRFFELPRAIQRRIFFSALNKIGFGSRFPFRTFETVLSYKNEKTSSLSFGNIFIELDCDNLSVRLSEKKETLLESGFSFLISDFSDRIETYDFSVSVRPFSEEKNEAELVFFKDGKECVALRAFLPLIVRSPVPGDCVFTSDGFYKNLSDVFSDWKISEKERGFVPVVEELSDSFEKRALKAVIASFCGGKNWISR